MIMCKFVSLQNSQAEKIDFTDSNIDIQNLYFRIKSKRKVPGIKKINKGVFQPFKTQSLVVHYSIDITYPLGQYSHKNFLKNYSLSHILWKIVPLTLVACQIITVIV